MTRRAMHMLIAVSLFAGCAEDDTGQEVAISVAAPGRDSAANLAGDVAAARLDLSDGAASASGASLTGTVNPIDCGYSDGRRCKSRSPLVGRVQDTVLWDPCYGGKFRWTANVQLQRERDRACVGGIASAGPGGRCSAGSELGGSGVFHGSDEGAVEVSLATEGAWLSLGILSLDATCDEPLQVGVFRKTPAGSSQQVVMNLDWLQFTAEWAARSDRGKRLSQLEAWYDTDGTTRFDGVFVPGVGPYGLNAGMTLAQLRAQRITNAGNGMELVDVDALQTGGGIVYIGVWRAGARKQDIYDGPVTEFWSWMERQAEKGFQPTIVESYYDNLDVHRYTVVVTLTPGSSGWAATVGVEYGFFAREWRKWNDMGLRLTQLETHVQGGIRFYDGFFLPGSGREDFVPGAREIEFDQALARDTGNSLEVIDFDRVKLERTAADASLEEQLAREEYPVVSPVWMAKAQDYFWDTWNHEPLGYTVGLMRDGRLLGASSVGFAQSPVDGGVRLTSDAQWDYMSDAKWITTLAAARLAQEKGLDVWNIEILPVVADQIGIEVPDTDDPTDFWHITVHQAMTHTSNLLDGGCTGPTADEWDIYPDQNLQNPGGSGNFSYSGFDSCLLRLWIEHESGMSFPRYVDTHLFRENGIHNLDCIRDPEKTEVLMYDDPADPLPGRHATDDWCGHHGFKGTPLQLLQILQMVRAPDQVLSTSWLNDMRTGSTAGGVNPPPGVGGDEWTFFQSAFDPDGDGPDAYGFSMTGGAYGLRTHMAQFPAHPFSAAAPFAPASYDAGGIDAVFFTNAGPADGSAIQWMSMEADPDP